MRHSRPTDPRQMNNSFLGPTSGLRAVSYLARENLPVWNLLWKPTYEGCVRGGEAEIFGLATAEGNGILWRSRIGDALVARDLVYI